MQWSVLWHLRLKFIYNFHMHQIILLIRFADFTTKRTKWIKSWVVYVYITLDMSSLLWICLHVFDYVYITLSPLLWICLHYLCYDYIFFVYMYITMDMFTLHWVHLPSVSCVYMSSSVQGKPCHRLLELSLVLSGSPFLLSDQSL